MLSHILIYIPAKLVPAALSLLALGIFTRALTVDQYGYFAVATAIAFALDGFLGQWLMAAIMRFHARQGTSADLKKLLGSCGLLYVLPAFLGCWLVTFALLYAYPSGAERNCLLLAAPYFFVYSLAQLLLRIRMAGMDSVGFVRLALAQSFIGTIAAIGLVGLVLAEPTMILIGLILGSLAVLVIDWRMTVDVLAVARADRTTIAEIVRFGWTGIFASGFSILSSRMNRFVVLAYLGPGAVGFLNAAQSLTEQALSAIFMIVAMAAQPMSVKAQEAGTEQALQRRLRSNAIWILGLGLPGAVGFALLSPELTQLVLGAGYHETGEQIIPWIAAAALFNGFRSHFLVHSFFLANKLEYNLYLAGFSLLVMLGANSALIPIFGMMGAVFAVLATETAATCFALWLTRSALPMPIPLAEAGRIVLATLAMSVAILTISGHSLAVAFVMKLAIGVATYGLAALLLNINGARSKFTYVVKRRSLSTT